jgi:hypothetical protein
MLGPPRANDCERFFELGGGDLLPAPTPQEHEPPRPIKGQSLEAPEPTPPGEVAGLRVGCAVRFDPKLDLRAFDKRGQNLAGDVRVNSVAVSFFFPSIQAARSSGSRLEPCPPSQTFSRRRGIR